MIGIYSILNVFDDKIYIGQSRNVERRIREHISKLTNSRHPNSHLQGAFDKYGLENFVFSPMLECDEDKLNYYKVKYISEFDSTNSEKGYNLKSGGHSNKKMSEGHVRKQRESFKGENNYSYGNSVFENLGGVSFLKSEIRNGKSQRQIEREAGVYRGALRNYLKTRNLSWKKLGGGSNKDWNLRTSVFHKKGGVSFLKSEIRNGKSQRQIEREAGVSNGALYNYLKTRNLSWKKLGGKNLRERVLYKKGGTPFIKSEIRNGKSQRQIEREANVSRGAIREYLKRRKYTWDELKEEALSERE